MKKEQIKNEIDNLIKTNGNLKAADFNPLLKAIVDSSDIKIPSIDVSLKHPKNLTDFLDLDSWENFSKVNINLRPQIDESWRDYNPKIYLFAKRRKGGKKSKAGSVKYGWVHPCCAYTGSFTAMYPRQQDRVFTYKDLFGRFDNVLKTVFDIPEEQDVNRFGIDFNPANYFYYLDRSKYEEDVTEDINELFSYPVPKSFYVPHGETFNQGNIFSMNGKRYKTPGSDKGGTTKRVAQFRFAIGIENPKEDSKNPIIFGEMSDVVEYRVFINREVFIDRDDVTYAPMFLGEISNKIYRTRVWHKKLL